MVSRLNSYADIVAMARIMGAQVLLITDEHLANETSHIVRISQLLDDAGIRTVSYLLSAAEAATVSAARSVNEQMDSSQATVCVAVGGGAVLDACKLGRAALDEPWLLDEVIRSGPAGQLAPVSSTPARAGAALVAVPSGPGAAAQVSPVVALSARPGQTRRLVEGRRLLPDATLIDPAFQSTLGAEALTDAVWEAFWRLLGPYLMAPSGEDVRGAVTATGGGLLDLGASLSRDGRLGSEEYALLHTLSMRTTELWQGRDERPRGHAWWCIQNSLVTLTGRTKGSLTAQAFAALLRRVAAHDDRFAWLPGAKLATLDESSLRTRALALRDQGGSPPVRGYDPPLLRACAIDVVALWSQLPAIRHLGVDGVLAFLDEAGFAAAR